MNHHEKPPLTIVIHPESSTIKGFAAQMDHEWTMEPPNGPSPPHVLLQLLPMCVGLWQQVHYQQGHVIAEGHETSHQQIAWVQGPMISIWNKEKGREHDNSSKNIWMIYICWTIFEMIAQQNHHDYN